MSLFDNEVIVNVYDADNNLLNVNTSTAGFNHNLAYKAMIDGHDIFEKCFVAMLGNGFNKAFPPYAIIEDYSVISKDMNVANNVKLNKSYYKDPDKYADIFTLSMTKKFVYVVSEDDVILRSIGLIDSSKTTQCGLVSIFNTRNLERIRFFKGYKIEIFYKLILRYSIKSIWSFPPGYSDSSKHPNFKFVKTDDKSWYECFGKGFSWENPFGSPIIFKRHPLHAIQDEKIISTDIVTLTKYDREIHFDIIIKNEEYPAYLINLNTSFGAMQCYHEHPSVYYFAEKDSSSYKHNRDQYLDSYYRARGSKEIHIKFKFGFKAAISIDESGK